MKRKEKTPAASAATQLRSTQAQPFSLLGRLVPLGGSEARLYESLWQSRPIIDAAITKLVRLVGGFEVECDAGQAGLREFLRTVPCGRGQRGK